MLPYIQFFSGLIIAIVSLPCAIYLTEQTPLDHEGNYVLGATAIIATMIGLLIFMTA